MALLYGELTKEILACFYEVHRELGHGFPEAVYSRAMAIAMSEAGLHVRREVTLNVIFRRRIVGTFKADTVVNDRIILEYKTSIRTLEVAEGQLLNYLRCTDMEVGLLLKFFSKASFKRMVFSNENKPTGGRPPIQRRAGY